MNTFGSGTSRAVQQVDAGGLAPQSRRSTNVTWGQLSAVVGVVGTVTGGGAVVGTVTGGGAVVATDTGGGAIVGRDIVDNKLNV